MQRFGLALLALVTACTASAAAPDKGVFSPIDMGGCGRAAVIEDAENADHQVLVHEGRDGYMYAFVDDEGTTVTPTAGKHGGTFAQTEGGGDATEAAAKDKDALHGPLHQLLRNTVTLAPSRRCR